MASFIVITCWRVWSGAKPSTTRLVAFLRAKKIASYKLPERLEIRTALPRNPVGKVLKRELRTSLSTEDR